MLSHQYYLNTKYEHSFVYLAMYDHTIVMNFNIPQSLNLTKYQMTEAEFNYAAIDRSTLDIAETGALSHNKHVCVSSEALLSHTNSPKAHIAEYAND